MGYILPVQPYQYEQYQVRDIKRRARPFQVDRLYRVMFETTYTNTANDEQKYDIQNDQADTGETHHQLLYSTRPSQLLKTPTTTGNEDVYADITGKGRTFNTQV